MGINPTKVTFLGTGTSQGVPVIACPCEICQSTDQKDKRLRSSIMITDAKGRNYVIDTGPDFRQQMLGNEVKTLEAIIYTHEHKDHVAGMDDVRAFNFVQQRHMDLYGNANVVLALHREFPYAFAEHKYPGVPEIRLHELDGVSKFKFEELEFEPIEVMHYKLPVLAFRVGNFAYVTDANFISNENKERLKGLDVLVLNALRLEKHISHFTLTEALELIAELQPKKAYLTHISHQLGKHKEVSEKLPKNVSLAHDGLVLGF